MFIIWAVETEQVLQLPQSMGHEQSALMQIQKKSKKQKKYTNSNAIYECKKVQMLIFQMQRQCFFGLHYEEIVDAIADKLSL